MAAESIARTRPRSLRRLLVSVAAVALALALVSLFLLQQRRDGGANGILGMSEVSRPLPRLEGDTLAANGLPAEHVTPADYRGKIMVVNFWATWCGPCRQEQPVLQDLWQRYRGQGVFFLGVDSRDDPALARAHLEEFDVTYPSIQDQAGAYAADFEFVGLPDTYLADCTGRMRYQITGRIGGPLVSVDEVTRAIDRLLADCG